MVRLALLLVFSQIQQQPIPLELMYEQGMKAVKVEDWDKAIERFEAIRAEEPGHLGTLFNLAISLSSTKKNDRAVSLYREILELDSSLFEAQMNLAILLYETQNLDAALEEFAKAAILIPKDPMPILYRAQILDKSGRNQEAEKEYRKVLAISPENFDVWESLGFLYRRNGRDAEAYEALIEAQKLGAQSAALFVNLGELAFDMENLRTARNYFENAMQVSPKDETIQLRLALTLQALREFPASIKLLKKIPNAKVSLGEAYFTSGQYDEAIGTYTDLVQVDPENAEHWYKLGRSLFETNEAAKAIPYLQQSLGLDPTQSVVWRTLATVYYSLEDWGNSGTMLLKYLEMEPNHAASHFALATCFDHLDNLDKALLHYNRFIQLDDGSNDARSFQVRQRVKALRLRLQ